MARLQSSLWYPLNQLLVVGLSWRHRLAWKIGGEVSSKREIVPFKLTWLWKITMFHRYINHKSPFSIAMSC